MSSPSNLNASADNRRFPLIPSEQLTSEQKVLVEAIRSGPRAQIQNSGASKPVSYTHLTLPTKRIV